MYWYFEIALAIFVLIWIYSIIFNMVQVFFVAYYFLVYVDPFLFYLKLG